MFINENCNQTLRPFRSSRNQVVNWAVSPDGKEVAILGTDGSCMTHGLSDGRLLQSLPHVDRAIAVNWSQKYGLFTMDEQCLIRQCDTDLGTEVARYAGDQCQVTTILVHDDSETLLAYHEYLPGKIFAWDLKTRAITWTADCPERSKVTLHSKEPLGVVTSMLSGTSLLDLKSGMTTAVTPEKSSGALFAGDRLIVSDLGAIKHSLNQPALFDSESVTYSIKIVDYLTNMVVDSIPIKSKPTNLSIDSGTNGVLATFETWQASICDLSTQNVELSTSFPSQVALVRAIPNSKDWLVASADGTCMRLDEAGKSIREIEPYQSPVVSGDVSPDGKVGAIGHLAR